MRITMPRGDSRPMKFKIKNKDGTECDIGFNEIYITFKESYHSKEALFQKRLTNKDITKDEDGYYHFTILPEDTENLRYTRYYFDIEVHNRQPLIKQTTIGILELTQEVTFTENEV